MRVAECVGPTVQIIDNESAGRRSEPSQTALREGWRRDEIGIASKVRTLICEAFDVAQGRYLASLRSLFPEAKLGVPLVHVVALMKAIRRNLIRLGVALRRGQRPDALPGVTTFTSTGLAATAAVRLPVRAGGNIVADLPVEFQLDPKPQLVR